MIKHWFSDVRAFRLDPLSLISSRGTQSSEAVVPLALGPRPVVLVRDPQAVKSLMKLSEEISDKGRLVQKLRDVIGASSLTLSGDDQRKRRAVLHERLSRGVASTYVPQMLATIRATCLQLSKELTFRADIVGGSLALKLICIALFGHRALTSGDEVAIMDAVNALEADLQAEMFRFLPRTPWQKRRDLEIRARALTTIAHIITKVRASASNSSVLTALTDLGLSDIEIRDEITTMIIAGYHTTGAAITWLIHYLACERNAADLIRLEYHQVSDAAGEIVPDRLAAASVSMAFVKEVLRLYPSAWWTTRELKQPTTVGNAALKKGTTLIVSPWLYHRDARNFEQPDSFQLNRSFASSSYLPFGAGPRACVGMGVALLELQLIALEFATTLSVTEVPSQANKAAIPGITLSAPPLEFKVKVRGFEERAATFAA